MLGAPPVGLIPIGSGDSDAPAGGNRGGTGFGEHILPATTAA